MGTKEAIKLFEEKPRFENESSLMAMRVPFLFNMNYRKLSTLSLQSIATQSHKSRNLE